MAGNVRGTGCGLLPACGRVRYPEEKLASRQRRRAGHGVPGRGVPGFCGGENPYGEWLWRCPTRCECPQKGSDTPGSGGMASPASGTGEFPLRCCGSPVQGREAPGIPAYPRGIRGEADARQRRKQALSDLAEIQKDVEKAVGRREEEEQELFPPLSQTRRISAVKPPEETKPAAHRRRRQAVFTVIQSDKQVQ